jgi:hypothetical protein
VAARPAARRHLHDVRQRRTGQDRPGSPRPRRCDLVAEGGDVAGAIDLDLIVAELFFEFPAVATRCRYTAAVVSINHLVELSCIRLVGGGHILVLSELAVELTVAVDTALICRDQPSGLTHKGCS